ncbi:hypothetical protein Deipr_1065 [Deinococcus proteolyticus MRP]|uniref:DUF3293 domain-containing protein n=1 Tax=Deinococcus proteolyticus (strain ATCC 35074 / DSM 20540 / JCM 6276 / NBRC 101906 / NCIMB 13154 / VKM Ac-1939 / CCM 2703 / MRP) TaxID=693977 RepID=F0RN75_DEIPM|nr:DUF3293 domain-containing protein [Deinococcus proteolyticus]ADY26217.1 hypothetical protein Deipr_1065 [Deinococcus proteolyticus MRP]
MTRRGPGPGPAPHRDPRHGDPLHGDPLRHAFLTTRYGTAAEPAWLSGRPGPGPGWAAGRWGIVTAWNPAGQQADSSSNAARQAELERRLRSLGRPFFPGHNGEGEWQEPTFIVRGLGPAELAGLGGDFGQAAVLHGSGTRAALLWLDGSQVTGAERRWLVSEPPQPA